MGNVVNPNKMIPNMPQKGQYKSSPNGSCCIPIGEMYLLLISNGLATRPGLSGQSVRTIFPENTAATQWIRIVNGT